MSPTQNSLLSVSFSFQLLLSPFFILTMCANCDVNAELRITSTLMVNGELRRLYKFPIVKNWKQNSDKLQAM
jgi:hypothetical protein